MKLTILLVFIFCLKLSSFAAFAKEELYSDMISPQEAWKFLTDSKYHRLPFYQVTYGSFISRLGENMLLTDSKRTVVEKNHFIPFQRKLIFPNGICVRGNWQIDDHKKGYTGYFKPGSDGVVIGRIAAATGKIFYKQYRTIGLSGKIFPTTNPDDIRIMEAANFITMNAGGGGRKKEYVTEAFLTNAAPSTAPLENLPLLKVGLTISKAFQLSDKRRDVRQLYQIAELEAEAPYHSPKWLWLRASKESIALSRDLKQADFREEAKAIIDSEGSLSFDIMISDVLKDEQPIYEKIGELSFDSYVASAACDQSIHFQHIPYSDEYELPEIDQDPKKILKRRKERDL